MIPRYVPEKMAPIWTPQAQFRTWLEVELAVVRARCNLSLYQANIIDRLDAYIGHPANFMTLEVVEDIIARDRVIEHDLQAFVEVVRELLPENLRHYIHDGLTSYDTEVPALALQFQRARAVIMPDLTEFIEALRQLASRHMFTYRMGMTHGQDAEPTTFGWLICSYIEMMEGAEERLADSFHRIDEVKCSGAVGNYATLSPELEAEVCRVLGLEARRAATQIVGRDVFSHLLSDLATAGGVIEKIATDWRLLATSPFGEAREPRKKGQRGSSAMPHKKNTILCERLCGIAIILRGYAVMGQELIRTWLERDISHSSVERIAFPDATCVFDYMLKIATRVASGLEVNRQAMADSISRSRGCWASEQLKLALEARGIEPKVVYEWVQTCAFDAFDDGMHLRDFLATMSAPGSNGERPLSDVLPQEDLEACFDFMRTLGHLPAAYARFNLDKSLALPSNITP